ncbi:thioredoxin family protein [Haloarcula laminariae]|uniref:thioredoxin family protein n=1 Tax=Haloarcula laminariae TaxID=2961577 RepID=UPI002404A7A0|nr:thioredoxin family protein [Halomicroarcula sp. FL173]
MTTETTVSIDSREQLDALLVDHERVLVMVRTAGCTICKSMAPILDGVARSTDATVVEFNPREDLDAVADFAVRSVPTFLLFVDGDLVDRRADGFVPTDDLAAFADGA